jgi:hypothetical protein
MHSLTVIMGAVVAGYASYEDCAAALHSMIYKLYKMLTFKWRAMIERIE